MSLTVYQYPACSTCRKALQWLDSKGIAYERVHIVERPPSRAMLEAALDRDGLPLRALFNTSGQSYRDGNFKERLGTMTREQALDTLLADGKLIKRPFVSGAARTLVGFQEAAWQETLR